MPKAAAQPRRGSNRHLHRQKGAAASAESARGSNAGPHREPPPAKVVCRNASSPRSCSSPNPGKERADPTSRQKSILKRAEEHIQATTKGPRKFSQTCSQMQPPPGHCLQQHQTSCSSHLQLPTTATVAGESSPRAHGHAASIGPIEPAKSHVSEIESTEVGAALTTSSQRPVTGKESPPFWNGHCDQVPYSEPISFEVAASGESPTCSSPPLSGEIPCPSPSPPLQKPDTSHVEQPEIPLAAAPRQSYLQQPSCWERVSAFIGDDADDDPECQAAEDHLACSIFFAATSAAVKPLPGSVQFSRRPQPESEFFMSRVQLDGSDCLDNF